MLKIFGDRTRHCDGITRRSFLEAGALGVGGLALPDLLRIRASAAAGGESLRRSVILFWLSGASRVPRPLGRDRYQPTRDVR
jgi:hypothetical protein